MNRRGFALAAGFLFLSATVLFIVNVHLYQMNWQAVSMSRSTVMDNLYYQRVDRVQAFWAVAKRVFEDVRPDDSYAVKRNFTRAIKSWGPKAGMSYDPNSPGDFSNFDGATGGYVGGSESTFGLENGTVLTGELEAAGHTEDFKIKAEQMVIVTSDYPYPDPDRAVIYARKT